MSKRRIIAAIALAACLAAAGGAYVYNEYVRTQNVFDQMYHTRMNWLWVPSGGLGVRTPYSGLFTNMKQTRSSEAGDSLTLESYRSEYLDPDTTLVMDFFAADDERPELLYITYTVNPYDENRKRYSYKYDLSTRTLTYTSNDPGNAERKAFLYDILLEDWFEANPNTRFSLDDLGDYAFVDGTG